MKRKRDTQKKPMQIGERTEYVNGQAVIVRIIEPMPATGSTRTTAQLEPRGHGKLPSLDWYDRNMR